MKLILDLDTGIDDALALAYALSSPEAELLGVVGSHGNVLVEEGVRNTLRLLELLGHPEIPVFAGETCAMGQDEFTPREISRFIHGQDGIGNVNLSEPVLKRGEMSGVDFMIDSARKYGKELTIVSTAPLTNLACVLKKAPDWKEQINKIVIMGGALLIPGNVTPFAEANIFEDPEAAKIVMESGADITMVGLDVTHRTLFTKKETALWRTLGTKAANVYADMVEYYIKAYETTAPYMDGCALHDPLAVAVAVDAGLAETISLFMTVETQEGQRGRTVGDSKKIRWKDPKVKVCVNIDVDRFQEEFMKRLSKLFCENR